jgi:hypothetical protein
MLNIKTGTSFASGCLARSQKGVVLFLALIALVALTLGGLALFRSTDMGVLVVGNLGMQRSATRAADLGSNSAIAWLDANGVKGSTVLNDDSIPDGYSAAGVNDVPGSNQTWAEYWDVLTGSHPAKSLAVDATTGNQVSYVIQRLCDRAGEAYATSPELVRCVKPPNENTSDKCRSFDPTIPDFNCMAPVYYRVTSRVVGPRNSISFTQTLVSK